MAFVFHLKWKRQRQLKLADACSSSFVCTYRDRLYSPGFMGFFPLMPMLLFLLTYIVAIAGYYFIRIFIDIHNCAYESRLNQIIFWCSTHSAFAIFCRYCFYFSPGAYLVAQPLRWPLMFPSHLDNSTTRQLWWILGWMNGCYFMYIPSKFL